MAVEIKSPQKFARLLQESPILVVKFYFEWCPYCQKIAANFDSAAEQVPDIITLASVNMEKLPQLASRFGVEAGPTFIFFDQGVPVSQVRGADLQKVADTLVQMLTKKAQG